MGAHALDLEATDSARSAQLEPDAPIEDHIASCIDSLHADICARQRELLAWVAAFDQTGAWEPDGCRDMAMWLAGRLGIRPYTARKWVDCPHAIKLLPLISDALGSGVLCLDKVVELTRWATRDTEARLIKWALRVSVAAIRAEAERATAPETEETVETERARSLRWWWYDERRALGLEGYFPPDQGAAIVAAIKLAAKDIPDTTEETGDNFDAPEDRRARRHADALWALASHKIAGPPRRPGDGGGPHPARERRGTPPRHRQEAQLRRPSAVRVDRCVRQSARHRADVAQRARVAQAPARVPRSRVHVSGVRGAGVFEGPPHLALGGRRADRLLQPRARVPLSSQARARVGVGGAEPARRRRRMVPTGRPPLQPGPQPTGAAHPLPGLNPQPTPTPADRANRI